MISEIKTDGLPRLPDILVINAARKLLSEIGTVCEFHAVHVARLSMAIFEELTPIHGLGNDAKSELACAALMHDLGVEIDDEKHHKRSRDLIRERFWVMDSDRRQRVALIARYHRKALPRDSHKYFKDLDPAGRQNVWTCMACLRLADGLDRTHRGLAKNVSIKIQPGNLQISVEFLLEGKEELDAAQKKSDGLEKLTRRKVIILPFSVGEEDNLSAISSRC